MECRGKIFNFFFTRHVDQGIFHSLLVSADGNTTDNITP